MIVAEILVGWCAASVVTAFLWAFYLNHTKEQPHARQ